MMKRRIETPKLELPPVRLYLDDIQHVVDLLRANAKDVSITTDEFTFEEVDDLQRLGLAKVHSLALESSDPHLHLSLRPGGANIWSHEHGNAVRGLAHEVETLIKAGRRAALDRAFQFAFWVSGWPLVLVLFALAGSWGALKSASQLVAQIGVALFLSVVGLSIFMGALLPARFKWYSTIVLKYRRDAPSFWRRKKDDIVLAIIAALVGSLVTLAVTRLTGSDRGVEPDHTREEVKSSEVG